MKNEKFYDLLKDVYTLYKETKNRQLIGIVYGAIITRGFSEIESIENMPKSIDMLYIKSLLTDIEISIYSYDLENYVIEYDNRTIRVKVKNRPEVAIMY